MGWATALKPDAFRRLRVQLSLWYGGVFGALLLGLGLLAYGHLASALVAGADDLNRKAASDLLAELSLSQGQLQVPAAPFAEELQEARELFNVGWVQLFDAQGRLVAHSEAGATPSLRLGPAQESLSSSLGPLRILRQPVVLESQQRGLLVVGQSLREGERALARLAKDLALFGPLALLAGLGAGALLAGKALRPIRAAFVQQQRFIADASHELRTPLAVLLAQAEAGLGGDADQAQMALASIQRQVGRLGRLVSGLLLLTRADAASLALERRAFELDELVDELLADLSPVAQAKGLRLVGEGPEGLLAWGEPESLRQLLLNLLDNALAHSPEAGAVLVSWAAEDGGGVRVAVRDQGAGIPEASLPHLFERFHRDAANRRPGSGLGLAIAKAIAEAHGGSLALTSPSGEGACFQLRLPPAPKG